MSGVPVPDPEENRLITWKDFREILGDEIEQIGEFVESEGGYLEVELLVGVYLIMDWEVEGLDDTFVLVDVDEVGEWYERPDSYAVTRNRLEVIEVDEKVGWGMQVFRDDARVINMLEDWEEDRVRVQIDSNGRMAPRLLTRLLHSLEYVDVDLTLEYSEEHSNENMDIWM